jgi:type IV secretion system protein VirB10
MMLLDCVEITMNEMKTMSSEGLDNDELGRLEQNLPKLSHWSSRRINKSAVAFVVLLTLLSITGGVWAFKRYVKIKQDNPTVVAEELVSAPDMKFTAPPVVVQAQVVPVEQPAIAPVSPASIAPVVQMDLPRPLSVVVPPHPTDPLFEQRRNSGLLFNNAASEPANPNATKYFTDEFADVKRGGVQQLANRDNLLVRSTYIRCVLETKIISDLKGYTSCVVTEPVYSTNGKKLLIPKGSRVSGEYQSSDVQTARVAVIWSRITTPTGLDVRVDSPGIDEMGSSGHKGAYKSHWASRFAASMMVSLLGDAFKVAASVYGPKTTVTNNDVTTENPFQSNTADTLQRSAEQALSRTINKPATVTIHQGSLITIYTSRDVDFSSVLN